MKVKPVTVPSAFHRKNKQKIYITKKRNGDFGLNGKKADSMIINYPNCQRIS